MERGGKGGHGGREWATARLCIPSVSPPPGCRYGVTGVTGVTGLRGYGVTGVPGASPLPSRAPPSCVSFPAGGAGRIPPPPVAAAASGAVGGGWRRMGPVCRLWRFSWLPFPAPCPACRRPRLPPVAVAPGPGSIRPAPPAGFLPSVSPPPGRRFLVCWYFAEPPLYANRRNTSVNPLASVAPVVKLRKD